MLVSEYQRCEDSKRLATTLIRKTNGPRRYNNDAVKPLAASTTEDTEDTPKDEGSDCQTHRRNINFPTIRQSLSIAQKRALKEMKAEKSIGKASKNQRKHTILVRREDIEAVVRSIHSDGFGAVSNDGHPLSTDKTIKKESRVRISDPGALVCSSQIIGKGERSHLEEQTVAKV